MIKNDQFALKLNSTHAESSSTPIPVPGTKGKSTELMACKSSHFRFLKLNSDQSVTKYITYRPPVLYKGKRKWIEYYYRVPENLKPMYRNAEWKKFRVFENINRYKSDGYDQLLLAAVEKALAEGYNPFEDDLSLLENEKKPVEQTSNEKKISLSVALDIFIEQCKEKGLRKKTVQSYASIIKVFKEYFLNESNRIYQHPGLITKEDIKKFIRHAKIFQGWNNHTRNNNLSALRTCFNYLMDEDIIAVNPTKGIEDLPTVSQRNTYYDDKKIVAIKKQINGAYILDFCEFIYYTGTRPKSEARLLKIKNLLFDRKLIFIPGEISKNKSGDYIPMSDELIKSLKKKRLENYPEDYYIWGTSGIPSEKPAGQNHFANLYRPHKEAIGLDDRYTIYSWKHTRAVHLAEAGANPYEIMKLFRHSSLEMTMKYLRDLGCGISEEINNKTRKF